MGRQALVALLPIGCALVLLGVLNHVAFHLNVPHFAIIAGVLAVVCIAIGGWASVQELRGAPREVTSGGARCLWCGGASTGIHRTS